MTPRSSTQTTTRSRTRSDIPSQEPKRKGTSGVNERLLTSVSSSIGKGDVTSRSVDNYDVTHGQDAMPSEMPFFKQDQYTDVVLQVYSSISN